MPTQTDILFERLRQFDEVTLLEVLDIHSDELIERFKDKILDRKVLLFGGVELMNIDDEEINDEEFSDGYEIENLFDNDDEE